MKIRVVLLFIFFLSFLFVSCVKRREIKVESEQTVVENAIKGFVVALESADRDKALDYYAKTPDIILIGSGDEFCTGYGKVENFYKGFMPDISQWKKRNFVLTELQIKFVDGVAWFSSKLTLNYELPGKSKEKSRSKLREQMVRFTGVLIKEEGNWKLVQEHMSISSTKSK